MAPSAILVLLAATLASPQTATGPQYASATRQGYSLTASQAQQLEQQLQANPEDLITDSVTIGSERDDQDATGRAPIIGRYPA